ncbi:hypothetical protein B296_00057308, partial [Ensete ventricosum]
LLHPHCVVVIAAAPAQAATALARQQPLCQRLPSLRKCGRSYIPVFQIWMKKMKEVKRPPLLRYPHDGSLQRNSSSLILQLLLKGR